MAQTASVTLSSSAYTALNTTESAVGCYVRPAQRVRLIVAASEPDAFSTDFIAVEPESGRSFEFVDFTEFGVGDGDSVYAMSERGPLALLIARGSAATIGGTDVYGNAKVVIYDGPDPLTYGPVVETKVVRPTWTVDTAAYAQNDCVGGLITLTDFAREDGGAGTITDWRFRSILNINQATQLFIFDADPTLSTTTDNATFALHVSDYSKLVRILNLPSASWRAPSIKDPFYSLGAIDVSASPIRDRIPYHLPTGRDLFAALVTDGALDFVAATDFTCLVSVENM